MAVWRAEPHTTREHTASKLSPSRARRATTVAALAIACGLAAFGAARAIAEEKQPQSNAAGQGAQWSPQLQTGSGGDAKVLGEQDTLLVQVINDYFNQNPHMRGTFEQIDPDSKQSKGNFYIERPGKVRFDYAKPSTTRIVSDGRYLSIEDHDIKTFERYPLEQTPFRVLLSSQVDLIRDSKILDLYSSDTTAIVVLGDPADKAAGKIRLVFSMPQVALQEWTITDAQGLDTRVTVANLVFGEEQKRDFFRPSKVGFPQPN